jgi:hypothetical protein
MSNHLIREKRVNKNGVAVTKLVLPNGGASATTKPMPSPSLRTPRAAYAHHRVAEHLDAFYEAKEDADYERVCGTMYHIKGRLMKYSDVTIEAYDKGMQDHPELAPAYAALLLGCLKDKLNSDEAAHVLHLCEINGEPQSEWHGKDNCTFSYWDAMRLYRGVASHDGKAGFTLPKNILTADDPKNVKIYRALAFVTQAIQDDLDTGGTRDLDSDPNSGFTLQNEALVDLVIRRPELASEIIELWWEIGERDGAVIEMMIDSPAKALNDGII